MIQKINVHQLLIFFSVLLVSNYVLANVSSKDNDFYIGCDGFVISYSGETVEGLSFDSKEPSFQNLHFINGKYIDASINKNIGCVINSSYISCYQFNIKINNKKSISRMIYIDRKNKIIDSVFNDSDESSGKKFVVKQFKGKCE